MYPTPPGIHPQAVAVPELVTQHCIPHVHCHGNESPAVLAYAFPCATHADPVVFRHVDVKHKLMLGGLQHTRPQRLLVAGHGGIESTDLEVARVELDDLVFEVICRDKQVVAQVDVAWEHKGKLAVHEELGWGVFMVEPLEDGF